MKTTFSEQYHLSDVYIYNVLTVFIYCLFLVCFEMQILRVHKVEQQTSNNSF
jgi:hypothetical protein